MMRRLRRAVFHAMAVLVWLSCGAAHAQCTNLGAFGTQADLTGKVAILEDAGALQTAVAVLAQAGWRVASPADLRQGATESAFWLRLRVCNTATRPLSRWLVLGSPRLEFVDYYQFSGSQGQLQQSAQSGVGRAFDIRPIPGVLSIFPVVLEPGGEAILLLRVAGRTLVNMQLGLWEPVAYREQEVAHGLSEVVLISVLLAVALLMLVHGLARLDWAQLMLGGWIGLVLSFKLAFEGYIYQYVFPAGGEMALRAPLVLSNLVSILCLILTLNFLALRRMRFWSGLFASLLLACFCTLCFSIFGSLLKVATLTLVMMFVLYILLPLSALAAWRQALPNARVYLLATLGLCLTALLRVFEQIGLPLLEWIPRESLLAVSSFGFVAAMLLGRVRQEASSSQAVRHAQAALLQVNAGEQLRLEEAVRNRTQALQEAMLSAHEDERVTSDLLSRVNRDLSLPVEEIIACSDRVIGGGGKEAEYAGVIKRSALHLASLMDDLADCVPGSDAGQAVCLQSIELHVFLADVCAYGAAMAQQNGNSFTYTPVGHVPQRLEIDVKRLRQVLDNLIGNAAKFTRGGQIDFQLALRQSALDGAERLTELVFEVRDTGPGIPPEDLPHIFDPFRRSKSTEGFPGLGLGLAIVRHWVERMGGRLELESTLAVGTTMRVFLPVKSDSPGAPLDTVPGTQSVQIVHGSDALPAGLVCPRLELLAEAEQLAQLGAVSDLADWAQRLPEKEAQYQAFAQLVGVLAERGDSRGISALLARCRRSQTPASAAVKLGAHTQGEP